MHFFHHVLRPQLSKTGGCFRNHTKDFPSGNRMQKVGRARKVGLVIFKPDNRTRDSSQPQAQILPSRSQGRSLSLYKVSNMTKAFCFLRAHQYEIGGKCQKVPKLVPALSFKLSTF